MSPSSAFRNSSRRRPGPALALGLLLLVLSIVAGLCQSRANALHDRWPPEADTFYLPPSKILKLASLGHSELAADLIHSRANVYFGTQLHARLPTKWLAQYLQAAIDLDPQFRRLYLAGAAMLVYNGQRIVPDMILAANTVLERGRQAFPFDWEIPFQLGFNLLYELPMDATPDDPRIPGWRQQGVEVLRQAALYEGVPYFIPSLVAGMLTKQGSEDLAVRHLEQAYAVATSEEARTQIRQRLLQLRGSQVANNLAEKQREFQSLVEGRYPDFPEAFSLVIGPRITSNGVLTTPFRVTPYRAESPP
ncbi:MAG TPA: hypothetical protein VJ860_05260 [Polyangia bacterium]|jgi:hypothetical protein|nr:hypothetical protein [Polyangia bacterium]